MNTRKKNIQVTQSDTFAVNAKICGLVSQYPCLYDRSDADYLKNGKNVWKEIGDQMNMQPKTCQQRWVNMRANFIRSIREHPEGSTYYLTNELEFLRKYITPGGPIPPRGRRRRVSVQEEDVKPKVEAKPKVKHAQSPNLNESEDVDTSSEEGSKNGRPRKRLRFSQEGKENVQSSISNRNDERVMDFDEAFLQGLRPEISQMNFAQKLYFKRRLYDLLSEIFATELATPSGSGGSSEVVNESNSVSEPPFSTLMQPIGLQLQLPKLTPKTQNNLSFRI